MRLCLQNIGKIKRAAIELNGITVIAGENNTGKSTVGKSLYSIFNSLYDIKNKIAEEHIRNIERLLEAFNYGFVGELVYNRESNYRELAESILRNKEMYISDYGALKDEILGAVAGDIITEENEIDEIISRIAEVIKISDAEFLEVLFTRNLNIEFNGQINNIFSDNEGIIELTIKEKIIKIAVRDNNVTAIENGMNLKTEAVYIDDPFVLDEPIGKILLFGEKDDSAHRDHLKIKLFMNNKKENIINEIVTKNKLYNIYSKLNAVCTGNLVSHRLNWVYKRADTDKAFNIKNISTGLKTFVILKTLLQNGTIEHNGTIILDEPEIHLHPEWQLIFAELIVLIQREFNMHILINTHSPYFLNALEVYADKHGIKDKCSYYLAVLEGDYSVINDVTDNLEAIYSKLARPFQKLENESYADD